MRVLATASGMSRKSAAISRPERSSPLRVGGQQAACLVERSVIANGRKHVEQFAVGFSRMADAVGGDHRQPQRRGQSEQRLVAALLVAAAVALQFEIEMRGAEDGLEPVDDFARGFAAALRQEPRRAGLHRRR